MAHRGRENADDILAVALATGATIADAATKAGISPRTVHRRLSDPEFRMLVIQQRAAIIGSALGRLADGMTDAVNTLRALLKADADTVKLGAARAMLESSVKLRDAVEMEERVSQIELALQVLNERNKP